MKTAHIVAAYALARERYAAVGVDTEAALERLRSMPVSLQCWQGDDVGGFERPGAALSGGGIQATGDYPGRARTPEELRKDMDVALRLIPGRHRVNLHASYLDNGGTFVDRDAVGPEHFAAWIDWAQGRLHGLDFNPTFFSHPNAVDGFTLSHPDAAIREFWITHGKACRKIGAAMGQRMGTPTVTNIWVPDGYKDTPVDREGPRARLRESLDRILDDPLDPAVHLDAVESKLFGIGAESYTVGSHEFHLSYAASRGILLCLDAGHFHPTESIADKISSVLMFVPGVLLHVSRAVRWDSDHVVTFGDDLLAIAREVIRPGRLERVHLGLDFFDASINRVAAWVIGARNLLKALLCAWLDPAAQLDAAEDHRDFTRRLAWQEEAHSLPWGAVWDAWCLRADVPVGEDWLSAVEAYERTALSRRC